MTGRFHAVWMARAACGLLGVRLRLLFQPGQALACWPARSAEGNPHVTARDLAISVERVARRLPFRPTCLEKALVLERLLAAAGLDASVIIGVRRANNTLDAHAWLEHNGQPLIGGSVASDYVRLLALRRTER